MHERFYTTEKLGEKQSRTPEGFLLCTDVPVARTGIQIYGPDETPVPVGGNGTLQVSRDEEAVFHPSFMASLNGKPVVNDHPDDNVHPENWKDVAVGTAMNPRRGSGIQSDLLVMDIVIYDQETIEAVRNGKREISLGYDADYDETAEGHAKQYNLMGNHIALVDAGRCGGRCAIGDKRTTRDKQGATMKSRTLDKKTLDARSRVRRMILDRLKAAVLAKDADLVKDAEEELEAMDDALPSGDPDPGSGDEPGDTHVHVGGTRDEEAHARLDEHDARHSQHDEDMAALKAHTNFQDAGGAPGGGENEEVLEEIKHESPPGADDAAMKATKDSTYLADSYQETIAGAEILVPGMKVPTFDKASDKVKTYDAICRVRRNALDLAYNTADGRDLIDQLQGGKPLALDTAKCGDIRTLFRSAVALKKSMNNLSTHDKTVINRDKTDAGSGLKGITSVADLNKRNAEFYGKTGA